MDWSTLLSLLGLKSAVQGGPVEGQGQDIEIPSTSGMVDPRLKPYRTDVGEHLRQSGEGYRKLMEATERLKR